MSAQPISQHEAPFHGGRAVRGPKTVGNRWVGLAFIGLAQLMVALDATIVSVALPSAQASLSFSPADRQWVITAYTMAFGGLLLLGGRLADRFGRTRTFVIGLVGFAAASAVGGAAPDFAVLVAARAVQGSLAALLAPTALSLLAVTFTEPKERATAFAVFGGIAGSGAAIGLLLGGALTQYLSWRWCLFVNVPVALVAAIGTLRLVPSSPPTMERLRFDFPGALLVTGALVALVYGSVQAVAEGWDSAVIALILGSGTLFALFVVREATAGSPLLPLSVVLDRTRGGAFLSVLLATAGLFGAFLFITYYLQVVLGFSPLIAGVAFLPITFTTQLGAWLIAGRLMPRVPPRALMAPGLLVAGAGMALLTQLHVGSDYLTHVLPAEALLGLGASCAIVPAYSNATLRVQPRLAGVAAATVNAAGQVGASIGTALLNTVAAAATANYLAGHVTTGRLGAAAGLVHGYATAAAWGAGILVLGALLAAALVNAPSPTAQRRELHAASEPTGPHEQELTA
ncbi:MAG: MFS transporter [Chloroflexi bacterium]|nr:MAG: MFS transporter [Chloroflexota bacterium]